MEIDLCNHLIFVMYENVCECACVYVNLCAHAFVRVCVDDYLILVSAYLCVWISNL